MRDQKTLAILFTAILAFHSCKEGQEESQQNKPETEENNQSSTPYTSTSNSLIPTFNGGNDCGDREKTLAEFSDEISYWVHGVITDIKYEQNPLYFTYTNLETSAEECSSISPLMEITLKNQEEENIKIYISRNVISNTSRSPYLENEEIVWYGNSGSFEPGQYLLVPVRVDEENQRPAARLPFAQVSPNGDIQWNLRTSCEVKPYEIYHFTHIEQVLNREETQRLSREQPRSFKLLKSETSAACSGSRAEIEEHQRQQEQEDGREAQEEQEPGEQPGE